MNTKMISYSMGVFLCVIRAGALGEGAAKVPSTEDGQAVSVKDAHWTAPPVPGIPAGALVSPIAVNPQTGSSVAYAKFPPGYSLPSHWHTQTEYTTVLSGKTRFVVDGKVFDLVAGSYLVIPAKAHHQVTCGADECVVLTRRAGPTDYHFDQ